MKKLLIAFLCLMLVLPLHVYADGTDSLLSAQGESQPPQPTESQPAESQPPQPTESQPAESQPPQPTESQPAESQPPQPTESQPAESQPPQPTETQPSEHTHVWDVSYTVPATCQEEGATAYGCSACGAISVEVLPKADHKFSTQWTKNASGHWHACSGCGEQGDFGKHYPGPAATEEKAQICLTCGYTLTAKLLHTHKYEDKWTSDETGHWHICSGCNDRKNFEAHSYDNDCDADCNVCGYVTATTHRYTGTWLSDETGHWDVCEICREQSAVEPHIPGPDATGTEAQRCIACGFELVPALAPAEHIHQGEGSWLADDENHWKTCSCGEETEKQPHVWNSGETQEDKTILYTCETCGALRTEGEPNTGIRPLVWVALILAVLLLLVTAALLMLAIKKGKNSKFGK